VRKCKNCPRNVGVRVDIEGLIHVDTGRYSCDANRYDIRKETVAE